jgi:hypothetical protein
MYSAGTLRRLQPHSAWFYSVYVHLHSGQGAAAACGVCVDIGVLAGDHLTKIATGRRLTTVEAPGRQAEARNP